MATNNGMNPEEGIFGLDEAYNSIFGQLFEMHTENIIHEQTVNLNDGTSSNASDEDVQYDDAGNLFKQPLVLEKPLESLADVRYKKDYFPDGGKNAGQAQAPRYLHNMDGQQEITIKFPNIYGIPRNIGIYYLEVALVTVSRNNRHYMHVNKFQLNHKVKETDENPFFICLTEEHLRQGEIRIKLVIIKTLINELKNIKSLPLFGDQTPPDWTADCQSANDLRHTYELKHGQIAFSLGYLNANNEFVRFPLTTVISNVFVEVEKYKPEDVVTCPTCSDTFSLKELKEKNRKRSTSSSNKTPKKRARQLKTTTTTADA